MCTWIIILHQHYCASDSFPNVKCQDLSRNKSGTKWHKSAINWTLGCIGNLNGQLGYETKMTKTNLRIQNTVQYSPLFKNKLFRLL